MISGLQNGDADAEPVAAAFRTAGPQHPSCRLFHDQGMLWFRIIRRQGHRADRRLSDERARLAHVQGKLLGMRIGWF